MENIRFATAVRLHRRALDPSASFACAPPHRFTKAYRGVPIITPEICEGYVTGYAEVHIIGPTRKMVET